MNKLVSDIIWATRAVFSSTSYFALGMVVFVAFFLLYAFFLPATYTGGRIGLVSLRYFSARLGFFAFLFSSFLAFIIPFSLYSFKKRQELMSVQPKSISSPKNFKAGIGGLAGSVLPPLLCCSPILPSLGAVLGGVFPFTFGVSGFLQGFIATYENQIYLVIVFILVYSLYQNSRQVKRLSEKLCLC